MLDLTSNEPNTMTNLIDISGLDKAELLAGLFNAATPTDTDYLRFYPNGMSRDQAAEILETRAWLAKTHKTFLTSFGIKGRTIKLDLTTDTLDPTSYDAHNGEGAAAAVVAKLRESP